MKTNEPLISVENLIKTFPVKSKVLGVNKGLVHAVNGVSFAIEKGETLGLVGESGSGKSTTGRMILRLLSPTGGTVRLEGRDISTIPNKEFRKLRRDLQIVFQNPYSALDYKMTIEDILIQPLQIHQVVSPLEYRNEVVRLLDMVGLDKQSASKFPHEFSGGQRQRIGIARALSTRPKFVVCDEPVSALDVSVQSQILNLTMDLQKEFGLSYLFIAHDLHVIQHVSDKVAVMYLGKVVEKGEGEVVFSNPMHPYTEALLAASPLPDPDRKKTHIKLIGEIPSAMHIPKGCAFHDRCQKRLARCSVEEPKLLPMTDGRLVACHLYDGPSRAKNPVLRKEESI